MERSPYWNPYLETLPREKLERLQLEKFKRIMGWAYRNSPFYRKLYHDAGIKPEDVRTLDDVKHVPKVDKEMLRLSQKEEPFPYGSVLAVPLEKITAFRQTSGTTGTPVYQGDTWEDWEWWSECWAYVLYAQGYRERDRVYIPFAYNIFVAFWAAHYAAEKIGCEVVPGGGLDTKARILKMKELRCTAFMATPTYVLGMADMARNKLGIDPKEIGIEKITCAGEPGASIPSVKKKMEDLWGCPVYDHAGATEIGAWGFECTHKPGGLHVNEAFFLVEIEDMETGRIITEPGREGKMIITALDRLGKPCIRFDSKDIIKWSKEPCSCGRAFRVVDGGVLGRADSIIKVKGVLLSPVAVEEVVRSFPEIEEFEVIVEKRGDLDEIKLRIELSPSFEGSREDLKERLLTQLRLKTNLGYRIEFCPYGTLPRYEVKAKRFKDMRGKRHGG